LGALVEGEVLSMPKRIAIALPLLALVCTCIAVSGADVVAVAELYEYTLTVGPELHNFADVDIELGTKQYAVVCVAYEKSAESGHRSIYAQITYLFPTKMLIEAVARYEDMQSVQFTIGWDNATYLTLFLTGFIVRVFYEGATSVVANATVEIVGEPDPTRTSDPTNSTVENSPLTYTNAVVVGASTVALIALVLLAVRRRR